MMKINHIQLNNGYCIQAFGENDTWLGTIVIDTNCDEYPRYKEYCNGDKIIKFIRVETNPYYVGQGIASTLIKLAIKKFQTYNIVLFCSPCKRIENTDTLKTVADLQMFYSKFGFTKTRELLPTMIYKANI